MKIDYPNTFIPYAACDKDLFRSMTNERVMQGLAIRLSAGTPEDELAPQLRKCDVYLGFWPMYYAEAMLMHRPKEPLDNQVFQFAQGMAAMIMTSKRTHRHIPFTEAVLLWDYLREAGFVKETSTQDMMRVVLDELSRRPQFQRLLTDLFSLNERTSVENHAQAMPSINKFMGEHSEFSEPLLKSLNEAQFRAAMNLFAPDVWKPHARTSVRLDMQISRDLGL